MPANIRALRTGRTRALVQRPRRKIHFATIAAGDTAWIGLCGRNITAEGAQFWITDASIFGDDHADDVCIDCGSMLALVAWALDNAQQADTRTARIAR